MDTETSFKKPWHKRLKNPTEEDLKLIEFSKLLDRYNPDFKKIVEANQFKKKNEHQAERYKIDTFCKIMKDFRKNVYKLSLRKFGNMCTLSHTYISDIEKGKIKSLPAEKLEFIADKFSTSAAYLIGLTNDRSYVPTKVDMYFWQFPKSPYREIEELAKHVLGEKARHRMITTFPTPAEKFKAEILSLIDNDPNLAETIYDLLSAPSKKRYRYLRILEELKFL